MAVKSFFIMGLILILNFLTLYSQDLKKVTKRLYPDMVEQYYVLKHNPEIKEGPYKLTINNVVYQIGSYKNNQRSGIWLIYRYKNVLDFKYNYDTKQLTCLNKENLLNPDDSTTHAPIYLGGFTYFLYCVADNLNTPDELKENLKSGQYRTIVSFLVDSIGNPRNFRVLTSSKIIQFDLEAISSVRFVSNSSFPFLPARNKGKPVSIPIMIPVNLSIEK